MGEYGSKVNLIASHHPEGGYTTTPIKDTTKDLKTVKQRDQNGLSKPCLYFFGFLIVAFVGSMVVIGAVYITHIQRHIQHLEDREQALEELGKNLGRRLKALETRSPNSQETRRTTRKKRNADGDVPKVRSKRELVDHEESEHRRAEHHGIASHHIAMVFGDPSAVVTTSSGSGDLNSYKFEKKDNLPESKHCGALYERRDEQMWCTAKPDTENKRPDHYMTSRKNHKFNYFVKAQWMNKSRSIQNYNLTYDGRIAVAHEGIYIVHASIFFGRVTSRDNPHYGVYKTDGLGNHPILISQCTVTVPNNTLTQRKDGVYPCQAWQLQHLKQGDQVFLRIGGYSWFRVEKETFHLALIRLNTDKL